MSEYKSCPPDVDYIEVPGERGPQGVQGPQGLRGPAGPEGKQGPQGLQGIEGCRGPKGDRGPRGEKGDPGRDGRDGAPGPQGPQGLEGPRGCKGNDGNVKFENLTPEQVDKLRGPIGPKGPKGAKGDDGAMGAQGPRGLQGETGPRGETGPAGPQGPMGPAGPIGPRGATGPMGPKGDGATIKKPVATDGVWSSQDVVNYALHGNVHWTHRKGVNLTVPETENGYVKNLKVLGRTLTNYSTLQKNHKVIIQNKNNGDPQFIVNVFDNASAPLFGQTYTIIYKVETGGAAFGENEKIKLTIHKEVTHHVEIAQEIEEKEFDLEDGVVKLVISPKANEKYKMIMLTLYTLTGPGVGAEVSVSMTAKEFMILSGDWTDHVIPEYFTETRGVGKRNGEGQDNYYIEIESRNKNLINEGSEIDDYYISANSSGRPEVGKTLRWEIETQQATTPPITFLVHCKPNTTYALRKINVLDGQGRLCVAGFKDDPKNGEVGQNLAYEEQTDKPDNYESKVTFTTGPKVNMLGLYLGRYKNAKQELSEILREVQLEEVREDVHPYTSYEKYTPLTKKLTLPRQLKDNEWIYWNDTNKKYMIHQANGQEIETANVDEHLIHTFDGMTYTYVKSRVPSELSGDFPIKAHNDYYTKDYVYTKEEADAAVAKKIKLLTYEKSEFGFKGTEGSSPQGDDTNNFVYLPNGFFMQWRECTDTFKGGAHVEKEFRLAKRIVYAIASPIGISGQSDNDNTVHTFKTRINNIGIGGEMNRVDIWIPGNNGNNQARYRLLIISDNRQIVPASEEEIKNNMI